MLTLANMGVPMLFVVGPVLAIAFIPIVLVEAWLYRRRIGVDWQRAVIGTLGANVLSTAVGVPLTWFALVILQMVTGGGGASGVGVQAVTWQAPWLIPYEQHLHWMIPAAGAVLCVPFFLASVLVERLYLRAAWKDLDLRRITSACWLGNALTYACLVAFWGVQLLLATPRP